ncbi:MAG: glycogen synthase [Gammaproteobacteria bacterium]|nr:glycogen synthase [Gammaproteobacteria bacterium]
MTATSNNIHTTFEKQMHIVHITAELTPIAKVGGLGDVVAGLSAQHQNMGQHVDIILPKYDCLLYDQIDDLTQLKTYLHVPWDHGLVPCAVWTGQVHGLSCIFIDPQSDLGFYQRQAVYGQFDDIQRFAFLSRAAIEYLWHSNNHPDIIHCHDWPSALAPVFLFEIYQTLGMTKPRVCFTIHNFKHQGLAGRDLLETTGLHRQDYFSKVDSLLDLNNPNALNLTKGGIVFSNFVTTVSPRHAIEVMDEDQGFGLEPVLKTHRAKVNGILNGVDYDFFNPATDAALAEPYSADTVEIKHANKEALRQRFSLEQNHKPLVAFIGRLDPQKGLDLIEHALMTTVKENGQFILLGSSHDPAINQHFKSLAQQFVNSADVHLEVGFDEPLSRQIYAGSDFMVVPSQFEPCGLTQLIAMRYGSVPIVRATGGLADTVFDIDYSDKPKPERNGFVFEDFNETGLDSALHRALICYQQQPEQYQRLVQNAMCSDYSWAKPAQEYLTIYESIRSNF